MSDPLAVCLTDRPSDRSRAMKVKRSILAVAAAVAGVLMTDSADTDG
ncbi:hypothetical protein [Rugosimonospora acidiphila]